MHLLRMRLRAVLSALQHCGCVPAELWAHCAGWVSPPGLFSLIRGGQGPLGEWARLISSVASSPFGTEHLGALGSAVQNETEAESAQCRHLQSCALGVQ